MAQIKIELNDAGIRSLLRSAEVKQSIASKASEIASRCGSGYTAATAHVSEQRAIVNIYPETEDARQDNYDNNTLVKELYK